MTGAAPGRSSWFQRLVLPGLAFKAVVIGGGYATGREIAEFFLPAGPWGGLAAMVLATAIWSGVAVLTFLFARSSGARDYRTFFRALLGRGWIAFEIAYALFIVLVLAVFGAAAGEIGHALFGWPTLVGALLLMAAIVTVAAYGTGAVESLFKWVSLLLYAVYAVFLLLALSRLGGAIDGTLATAQAPAGSQWLSGGIEYAGYNAVGAVVILPVLRHLTSGRDAVIAGLIAGPLAIAPALAFFLAMLAFYPAIEGATLPSDIILARLDLPAFRMVFQAMIFCALLESGTGAIHAVNERIAAAWLARRGADLPAALRRLMAAAILAFCVRAADRIGLVQLIASGYRLLSWLMLALFVAPLCTVGLRIARGAR